MNKLDLGRVRAKLAKRTAEGLEHDARLSAVRAALLPFEGKKITKRMADAVKSAMRDHIVMYSAGNTSAYSRDFKLKIWWGSYESYSVFYLNKPGEVVYRNSNLALPRRYATIEAEELGAKVDAYNAAVDALAEATAALDGLAP